MVNLEIFQAFVAPAIFISGAGLLVLTINARMMAIVNRLRMYNTQLYNAYLKNNDIEINLYDTQLKHLQSHAETIRNAVVFTLSGILGVILTSFLLGISVYFTQLATLPVISFVLSLVLFSTGVIYFIIEVATALTPVKEETQFYNLIKLNKQNT